MPDPGQLIVRKERGRHRWRAAFDSQTCWYCGDTPGEAIDKAVRALAILAHSRALAHYGWALPKPAPPPMQPETLHSGEAVTVRDDNGAPVGFVVST